MADKETKCVVRKAGKESVNMALELLRSAAQKTKKRKRNAESCDNDKIASYCNVNLVDPKESNAATGFTELRAVTEMKCCLARRDWTSLQQLFPLLLGCYSEIEPLIWRYAFILFLCSPDTDARYFQEFLEMCIGAQNFEDSFLLERLLTLQDTNSRDHNLFP